jgi:5-(carboxyamino)imidazole ribonucleotide synthase
VAYPIVATTQLDGICHEVVAPAPELPAERSSEAQQLALRIARELDVTGILAVELFEAADGGILVNELAMRPHNTGHWTQDGAVTSQFENHLRAVLDLPLGATDPRAPWTVMVNILGGPDPDAGRLYDGYPHALGRDPGLRVHLYGKELRPGRKVGHVNAYGADLDDCLARARSAAAWFRGEGPGGERMTR